MTGIMLEGKSPFQYRTHAVRSPISTHFRKATCEEVQCSAYQDGWHFHAESLSPEMLYVVTHSGRRYREVRVTQGQTFLVFEPGQPCFKSGTHVISLERPEWYFVGRGDSRVFDVRKARQHRNAENFVDDWSTHLDKIRRVIERG